MKNVFDLIHKVNSKPTRWHICKLCGDQFTSKRLLSVHHKYCEAKK